MNKAEEKVESLYKTVSNTIENWINKHCVESKTLDKTISNMLDKKLEEIILKLIGFDNRYGDGWQIDHCNGRSGNSMAGDYLKGKAQTAINAWLDKQSNNFSKINVSIDITEAMEKEFKSQFENKVRDIIRSKANERAEEFVDELSAKITLDESKIKDSVAALEFISVFSKVATDEEEK